MERKVSFGRVLKNDYGSFLMVAAIAVAWIICIGGSVLGFLPRHRGGGAVEVGPTLAIILLVVAAALTILLGWLVARRVSSIRRVITSGPEVNGHILSVGFVKDRGRVEYEYEFQGKTYVAGNAIMKNKQTEQIQTGDEVNLIVDPEKPSRAFLAFLYT